MSICLSQARDTWNCVLPWCLVWDIPGEIDSCLFWSLASEKFNYLDYNKDIFIKFCAGGFCLKPFSDLEKCFKFSKILEYDEIFFE